MIVESRCVPEFSLTIRTSGLTFRGTLVLVLCPADIYCMTYTNLEDRHVLFVPVLLEEDSAVHNAVYNWKMLGIRIYTRGFRAMRSQPTVCAFAVSVVLPVTGVILSPQHLKIRQPPWRAIPRLAVLLPHLHQQQQQQPS
jgi:hypothetical protein